MPSLVGSWRRPRERAGTDHIQPRLDPPALLPIVFRSLAAMTSFRLRSASWSLLGMVLSALTAPQNLRHGLVRRQSESRPDPRKFEPVMHLRAELNQH